MKNLDELTEFFVNRFKLKDGEKKFKTYRAKIRRTLEEVGELNRGFPVKNQKTNRVCASYSDFQIHKILQNDQFYDYLIKHSCDETIKNLKTRKQMKTEVEEKNKKELDYEAELHEQLYLLTNNLIDEVDSSNSAFRPISDEEREYLNITNDPIILPSSDIGDSIRLLKIEKMIEKLFDLYFTPFDEDMFFEDVKIVLNHRKLGHYGENTVETERARERLEQNAYCTKK